MVTSYPRRHLAIKLRGGKPAYKSGPEFPPLFLQRVLVALDTGRGAIYAPASGWDRVYLMWTFRNFHSLPQTVLNPCQQQLIGSLYRAATNHPAEELHEAAVVGTVEGFNPSALSALPNSSRARTLDPVGSAEVTAPDQGQPFHARFALNRMTLRVGAAALVAIIAILAWRELGAQPISNSELERIPPSARQSGNPIAMAKDLSPTTGPLSGSFASQPSPVRIADPGPITEPPAGAIATTETTAHPASKTSGAPGKHEAARRVASVQLPVAASPGLYQAAADQPRLHISGRPRKLVYPVCPRTDARGKVSLQAVVSDDGAVDRVRILTGNRVLAAAAIEAVRQWRYEPFSGAVQGLERETDITVSFISNEVVAVSFPDAAPVSR
jgi:TonB family protein